MWNNGHVVALFARKMLRSKKNTKIRSERRLLFDKILEIQNDRNKERSRDAFQFTVSSARRAINEGCIRASDEKTRE